MRSLRRAKRLGFCEHCFLLIFGLITNRMQIQGAILKGSGGAKVHGYDKP